MPSLRAHIVHRLLPLLGIKRFFAEPERIDARIAGLRRKPSPRPGRRIRKRFVLTEDRSRGYAVVTLEPRGGAAPGAPHCLYLHGGGYVMDIAAVHWTAVARLCEQLGASATVPLYPLAPEHKAAQTLAQMRALYTDLIERHDPRTISIVGDSAGGGMALALARMIHEDGGRLPAALALFSPWLDASASDPGQAVIERRDRILAASGLHACGQRYRGDLPLDDPRVSPLFGPLAGLPPMAVFAGTDDILLVDARRLAARLAEPGMPRHVYREYDGMCHVWMLLPMPEAGQALAEAARFIRAQGS